MYSDQILFYVFVFVFLRAFSKSTMNLWKLTTTRQLISHGLLPKEEVSVMFLRGIREDGVVYSIKLPKTTEPWLALVTPWVDCRLRLRSTKFSPHTTIVEFGDVTDDHCISLTPGEYCTRARVIARWSLLPRQTELSPRRTVTNRCTLMVLHVVSQC